MSISRKELTFGSGQDTCAAWFYPAAADKGTRPVIVMAHGLTGTRRDRLGVFAERFAAAGIAALVFDYRGFGDSTGEPDLYEPSRQLDDWRAAIALARSLCESARGPDADRHIKLLIQFAVEGSLSGAYSHDARERNFSNRRIRTRTYGGVGAAEPQGSPYPDRWHETNQRLRSYDVR